jgi:hypothetical protein
MQLRGISWQAGLGLSCLVALVAAGPGGRLEPPFLGSLTLGSGPVAAQVSAEDWPDTKPVTVLVEGEPQTVTMQLYDQPDVPLVTYYPPAMAVAESCDQDGCFISFTYEDLGAAVFFLFPNEASTASQIEPYITGPEGLLAGGGWTVTAEHTHATALHYPWAQKAINFQAADMSSVGVAYLGELEGTAFAAVEVFPPDAGDGFAPQAHAILSEMSLQ